MAIVTWEDDPEKSLGVVIPFNCQVDQVVVEVTNAVRALAQELETAVNVNRQACSMRRDHADYRTLIWVASA
jgi:hypothetical protein